MGPLLASPSPPVRQAAQSQDRSLVSGALLCASGHQGTEQNGAVPKDIAVHPVLMDRGGRDHVIHIDKSSEGRKIDFFFLLARGDYFMKCHVRGEDQTKVTSH